MDGNTKIMMSEWARRAENAHSTAKSNVSEMLKVSVRTIKLTAWALVLALSLFGGMTASAMPSPSNWLLNLSTASNPEYDLNNPAAPYWVNIAPQVAVSGQYVHVVWYSYMYSWDIDAKRQLVYRRSTDGGVTFEPAVVLLDETIGTDETYSGMWNSTCPQLAVDGAHVHIIYRWKTRGSTTPVGLKYRRSTNNGATFEPVVALVSPAVGAAGVDTNVFIAAQNGKVAIAYSTNIRVDNYMDLQASCLHSYDNGATFASTKLINYHSETGWTYYYVQVVDLVMSGDYVYAMVTRVDSNWYVTTGMDFIIGSSDGGVTFKTPAVVSAISEDGKYYPSVFRGGSAYSPNIAANGASAYVVWQNLYTDTANPIGRWRLMVRRTTDGFATIGDPSLVKEYPDGSGLPYPGLETIALKDGNLCIAAYESNGWTYIWNSTASGTSWGTGVNITKQNYTGDTLICPDTATGSTVFNVIANWYFRSTNGGATFNGGVNEHLPPGVVGVWRTPAMSVGADGVVHAIASYGDTSNLAIYYRRLATPPAPGATNKSLELVNNSDASAQRYDNMQAAGSTSLAFTTALTAEFWVKCTSDDLLLHFTPIVSKPLDYLNSFEIGIYPYTGQIYGQVMTESASSGPLLNSSGLVKDAWTHLAITYNAASTADNFKLYVNGVEANKATIVGNIKNITPDYPLVLGKTVWGGDKNSSMRIDELRLWNKALTAAEILAGKDKTMTGSEPGLVARYGFDDTTMDSTPNANNGILMFKESYVADHAPNPTPTPTLAASFASSGIWVYKSDSATWAQLSSVNPENMIYSGSTLYVDFGASHGLYEWDGTAWTQLTTASPENMVASGSTLYVDFGALGLYKWDGAVWSLLASVNPEKMVTSGSTLYVDFGASYGLYKWDSTAWAQLTSANPENMVTSGLVLYVDFGALGLYRWDGTAWSQLTFANPENMVTSGSVLYVDFGASYGLYKWDGAAWAQLTSVSPENMITSASTLYVNFGASYGLYKWDGAAWAQLTSTNPENMVASGSLLYVDFGAAHGLYKWDGSSWSPLTGSNPDEMAVSN